MRYEYVIHITGVIITEVSGMVSLWMVSTRNVDRYCHDMNVRMLLCGYRLKIIMRAPSVPLDTLLHTTIVDTGAKKR